MRREGETERGEARCRRGVGEVRRGEARRKRGLAQRRSSHLALVAACGLFLLSRAVQMCVLMSSCSRSNGGAASLGLQPLASAQEESSVTYVRGRGRGRWSPPWRIGYKL